jgi:peptide/nickel transport system ATP-binding protein
MSQPILDVRDLTVQLQGGITVVDGLTFQLHPGKTLALVGESGSGKSMTALALMGLQPATGSVLLNDRNLLTLKEKEMRGVRGRRLAMIFQDPMSALNPVYSVGEQLREVANHTDEEICQTLLDVGIADPASRLRAYPHQLSGGLKQRIMIAMALLCEPDILIADEPTTALDVTIQAQILELMRNLQEKRGMAMLFITHDMGVVAEVADEVIVMYASQAVEQAPVSTLFDQMKHPYTRGLFHARPHGEGKLEPIPGTVPSPRNFPSGCHFHPRCSEVMPRCSSGGVPMYGKDHEVRCHLMEESCCSKSKG